MSTTILPSFLREEIIEKQSRSLSSDSDSTHPSSSTNASPDVCVWDDEDDLVLHPEKDNKKLGPFEVASSVTIPRNGSMNMLPLEAGSPETTPCKTNNELLPLGVTALGPTLRDISIEQLPLRTSSIDASLEQPFSPLSFDLEEDDTSLEDWEQVLDDLSRDELYNNSKKTETKKKDKNYLKGSLLKKPAKKIPGKNFTAEERRERNRISAANSRIKKDYRVKDLEAEVEHLKATIVKKDMEIELLKNEVSVLNGILYQERKDGTFNAKANASSKKRKRIRRSNQPMLSKSAKISVLCCVSVCLALSPLEGNSENYFAFAIGGIQHTHINTIAYMMVFLAIVACSVSINCKTDTIFASLARLCNNGSETDVAKNYILPFYWISTAIRKDVSLCDEAVASSYVPKASLR